MTLTSPFTPMLFMGEEWGATTPFAFFTDHPEEELGRAVSEGRRREFERMAWGDVEVPDPQHPATYAASTLDWSEVESPRGRALLAVYRDLARLRRELPALTDPDLRATHVEVDEDARWLVVRRGSGADAVVVAVSFADVALEVPLADGTTYAVALATPGAGLGVGSPLADRLTLPPGTGVLLVPDLAE